MNDPESGEGSASEPERVQHDFLTVELAAGFTFARLCETELSLPDLPGARRAAANARRAYDTVMRHLDKAHLPAMQRRRIAARLAELDAVLIALERSIQASA